jgi:acyl-CoA thioester hydrolase
LHDLPNDLSDPGQHDAKKGIALAEARCRFKVSLTFPDDIIIGSAVGEIGEHHFMIVQEIYSSKMELIAAEGDARMVYYDFANKKKVAIDGEFLALLEQHQLR